MSLSRLNFCLCLLFAVLASRAQAQSGFALSFDGTNDFVRPSANPFGGVTNTFTMEAWVRPAAARATTAEANTGISGMTAQRYAVFPDQGDATYGAGHAGAGISVGTNGISVFEHAASHLPSPLVHDLATTGWTHVAVVYLNRQPQLYVNGVLARTGATSTKTVHPGANLGEFGMGYGFFGGQLDEFRVWNVARTEFEIRSNLFKCLSGAEAGLVVNYHFNEGAGATTADSAPLSGNPTGNLSNGVAWVASTAPADGLVVTMEDSLLIDTNNNGKANENDTLRYTITIQNNGTSTLSNVVLNVPLNPNTALVPGSLNTSPKALADGPASNSVPGNPFHVAFSTAFHLSAPGLLANDLGSAIAIASFGGGSFPGTAATTAAGSPTGTAGVGSLTVNADGSLTFAPAATFNGLATFQYRLTNAAGASIAHGTIGVGLRPSASNETYLVTGNTMIDTTLGGLTPVLANDAGSGIGISGNTTPSGSLNLAPTTGHFTYVPGLSFTGTTTFNYTITNGFGPAVGTATLIVSNLLWYIDNSVAMNGDGRSISPFKNTSDFSALNDGAAGHPANNQAVFLRQGSSHYTGGTVLRNGQKLIGDGAAGSFSALFGFTLAPGSAKAAGVAVPGITGVRPFLSVASGTAISLGSGNLVLGLNVHSANGRGFSGAAVGNLAINNVALSAAGDRVLNLSNGTANVALDHAFSTNSVDTGITLAGLSGAVIITNGFITGAAGTDVQVFSNSASVTFGGGINSTAGRSVSVNANTGAVTLSGNITDTGTGVLIQNCTAGTVQFTGASKAFNTGPSTALTLNSNANASILFSGGGLDIDTTTGAGISIVGSGNITVSGASNSINSTAGTAFFNSGRGGTATIDITADIANTTGRLLDIQARAQANNLTLRGNLTNNGGSGILILSNSAGTLTFSGAAKVLATGDNPALTLHTNAGASITFNNTGLDIDTAAGAGIWIQGGGTVVVTGGNNRVTTSTGTAFLNSGAGGSAFVDCNAALTSMAGRVIDIQNRATGNVTLSGNLNNSGGTGMLVQNNSGGTNSFTGATKTFSTGTHTAVDLVNNTGATLSFLNPLVITTTNGTGFNATGGGTVTVQNSGAGNTINSGTGTAVNIVNTTIGASGVSFRSISASGGSNGIVLNNTGGGGFTVTGSGSAAPGGDDSGGVIQNLSNYGIALTGTVNPSFRNMNIRNVARNGIDGSSGVRGFAYLNGKVSNCGTGAAGPYEENLISFNDGGAFTNATLIGMVTITGNTFTQPRRNAIAIESGSGTITNLVISTNTISGGTTGSNILHGILVRVQGSAGTTGHVLAGKVQSNTISGFRFFNGSRYLGGSGIFIAGGSGHASNNTAATLGAAATPIEISGNDVDDVGSNAIQVAFSGQQGISHFHIHRNGTVANPMSNMEEAGISVLFGGSGTFSARVNNNAVTNNGPTVNGGAPGIAVQLEDGPAALSTATGVATIRVLSNHVANPDGFGIRGLVRASLGTLNLYIQTNHVGTPRTANLNAIRVESGSATGDTTLNLNMAGNSGPLTGLTDNLVGSGLNAGIGLRKQGTSPNVNNFNLQGIGANPSNPQVQAYVGSPVPPGKNYTAAGGGLPGSSLNGNGVDIISGSAFRTTNAVP